MSFQSEQEIFKQGIIYNYIIPVGVVLITAFIGYRLIRIVEFYYASKFKKPLFNHLYFRLSRLTALQRSILNGDSEFYKKLTDKQKLYFEHRVAKFIDRNEFIGKQGIIVTDQMKVLIGATAVMLTFGFRKYKIDILNKVVLYPQAYFSEINEVYHKGETNPQLKTIVFSWEDFKRGYKIGDDNLNLGIHEFGHAIHLNAQRNNDVSSLIFNAGYNSLTNYLQEHEVVRQNLIASKYFRAYAYTNQFEFFAVLLENFIETPLEFKSQFPKIYMFMRQTLNLKVAGY